jgi:hypothetical protein
MDSDNLNNSSGEEEDYEDPHLIPEEETTTHADFGGRHLQDRGAGSVQSRGHSPEDGLRPGGLDGKRARGRPGVLRRQGRGRRHDCQLDRVDSTDSRFLVPRSFLENAEEHWIFQMRPRKER